MEELIVPILDEIAIPELPRFTVTAEPSEAEDRTDAIPIDFIRRRLGLLDFRLGAIFDEAALGDEVDLIGKRVSAKNMTELRRVVGISIKAADPGVAALVNGWQSINVSMIKSLAGQELVDITTLLESATATGLRVEALRDQIREKFGGTKARAALLARDQTLTLNAQIARQRQTNLGIEQYVWTTAGDGHVRDTHEDLEGTTQRWDNAPEISEDGRTGHPGDDYQCRCTAFPVLPELA